MAWQEVLLRLSLALVIGFFVGMERERLGRPAGIKTHIMVCIGAATVSLIALEMVNNVRQMIVEDPTLATVLSADLGRLGAQVISGIGFLGAGTIIVRKNSVKGLTTAATLWLTACAGLAVGMGYYTIALIGFGLALSSLLVLRFIQVRMAANRETVFEILMSDRRTGMNSIESICFSQDIKIGSIEFTEEKEDDQGNLLCTAVYVFKLDREFDKESFIMDILRQPGILKISGKNE